jgi:hypothetical protein
MTRASNFALAPSPARTIAAAFEHAGQQAPRAVGQLLDVAEEQRAAGGLLEQTRTAPGRSLPSSASRPAHPAARADCS